MLATRHTARGLKQRLRRRRLHRVLRARARLRGDHGAPLERAWSARCASCTRASASRSASRSARSRTPKGHRRARHAAPRRPSSTERDGQSELLALGISHKTAPVALRERLAFTESQAATSPAGSRGGRRCARRSSSPPATAPRSIWSSAIQCGAETEVLGLLAQRAGIRPTELAQQIYSPRNCDAARQLYRVTAGLESMIVGEAEIQGQVKRAHESAMAAGLTGPLLQPPVRGGADDRQARALGDGDRLLTRERALR